MTTPQFTPDGRLLQVEYASTAANLSTPLAALQMDETDNTLVLVSLRVSNTQMRMVLLQDDSSICTAFRPSDDTAYFKIMILKIDAFLMEAIASQWCFLIT
jgi:hypothetical protein